MTVTSAGLAVAEPVTEQRREPRVRWGLRRRIMLIFTVGALVLSLFLAFITYGFARSSVVQQRENAAFDSARNNAQIVYSALGGNATSAQAAMQRLEDIGVERPLIWYNGQWTREQPAATPSPSCRRRSPTA